MIWRRLVETGKLGWGAGISVAAAGLVSVLAFAGGPCFTQLTNDQGQPVLGVGADVSFSLFGVSPTIVNGAIGNWQDGCPGQNLPGADIGGAGDINFDIIFHPGSSGGECGVMNGVDEVLPDGTRRVTGGQIHLWESGSLGLCDVEETLTHEMGHMYGLGHTPTCSLGTNIMHIDVVGKDRTVQSADCEGAELFNATPTPTPTPTATPAVTPTPNPDPCGGGSGGATSRVERRASVSGAFARPSKVVNPCGGGGPGGGGPIERWNGNSPIVLNLNRGAFRFTDIEHGVAFDMDGNGIPTEMSWTDPNEGDAFLALDRDGNGTVDDGGELFGNFTEQPASENPNGYLALAVFDQVDRGGNGDGLISEDDQIFGSLLVWIDGNQNGFAEGYELSTLADAGVENLELDYVESARTDRYGNLMPFKSSGRFAQGGKFQTVDVFFLTYEEEE